VFAYCAMPMIPSLIEGYNATLMCYGQTGGGKTFTMVGSSQNYKYRGLIPRAVNQLFQEVGSRFDQAVTVRVSYIEIYNELVLLSGD
jgi:kinesin family protein 6/9